ncbi:hypothetical protein SAMN04487770_12667 [Butyrivibrio sp. ob235]|nr:hypothetical protein SAMN04487770_12667 [Butyrivibrio sp. ob235]
MLVRGGIFVLWEMENAHVWNCLKKAMLYGLFTVKRLFFCYSRTMNLRRRK